MINTLIKKHRQQKHRRQSKRAFTLLELLICLAIIGMVSVIFSIKGRDLLEEHQVKKTIGLLLKEVEKAKFLSLAYRTDISLELLREKGKYSAHLKSDEPRLAKTKKIQLTNIDEVRVKGEKPQRLIIAEFSSGAHKRGTAFQLHSRKKTWQIDEQGNAKLLTQPNYTS